MTGITFRPQKKKRVLTRFGLPQLDIPSPSSRTLTLILITLSPILQLPLPELHSLAACMKASIVAGHRPVLCTSLYPPLLTRPLVPSALRAFSQSSCRQRTASSIPAATAGARAPAVKSKRVQIKEYLADGGLPNELGLMEGE